MRAQERYPTRGTPSAGHGGCRGPRRPDRSSDLFEHDGEALSAAYAEADERIPPSRALELAGGSEGQPGPRGAEGVPDGDRAAIRVHPAVLEVDFEALEAREDLGGERFVDLDDIDILDGEPGARQRLLRSRNGPDAHDLRRHAGGGAGEDARKRLHARLLADLARADEERDRPVVYAGCVAGGRDPALVERLHLRQNL